MVRFDKKFNKDSCFIYAISDIEFWSKNKEDVENYLSAKKYNL